MWFPAWNRARRAVGTGDGGPGRTVHRRIATVCFGRQSGE
ncbi:MAG: hypothetical protein AVDCRST_MAG08-558 [uncultured Acetobacteraceae bacterium]|uniref:Uncharacterized protein n=1 Tax=uncultured Acetobacteraceae bacterium TaxID=169975 RepID=A0A6J4HAK8_9PROT|nr:MAG: hypothetical protein AVDCRST_MAG08-558 [uncultured Acetobacteraceae bacterium]